ncbi:MAG: hypothetical protein SF052_00890 [Bacteroidia bacterium]|nr:hypothetical protein [Bacteroidia bacterium]
MNKWITTIMMAFVIMGSLQAQDEDISFSRAEKIESFRVAFFTQKLNLTTKEAEKFWPVYNAFLDEQESLRKTRRALQLQAQSAVMGDDNSQLEKLSDDFIHLKGKEAEIAEKYHTQFKTVLPIRKVLLLYKTETEFKKEILEEIRRRQMEKKIQEGRPGIRQK